MNVEARAKELLEELAKSGDPVTDEQWNAVVNQLAWEQITEETDAAQAKMLADLDELGVDVKKDGQRRWPAGDPRGGQFAPQGAGGGGGGGGGGDGGKKPEGEDGVAQHGAAWLTPHKVPKVDYKDPPGKGPLTAKQMEARQKAVDEATADALGSQYDTQVMHDRLGGKVGAYTPERAKLHEKIINDVLDEAIKNGVKSDGEAIFMGGLGGAGKSTILAENAKAFGLDMKGGAVTSHLTLNPDDIKERLSKAGAMPKTNNPWLTDAEKAGFVHEESSDITNQIMLRAQARGLNLIFDGTMGNPGSVTKKLATLKNDTGDPVRDSGPKYKKIRGIFVDVGVEFSVGSALGRWRQGHDEHRAGNNAFGGRYVPPKVIRESKPTGKNPRLRSKNAEVFKGLFDDGVFDEARFFDNEKRDVPVSQREVNMGDL
jgi:hypothetical protein